MFLLESNLLLPIGYVKRLPNSLKQSIKKFQNIQLRCTTCTVTKVLDQTFHEHLGTIYL